MSRDAIATSMYRDTDPARIIFVEGKELRNPRTADEKLTAYVDGSISCPRNSAPKPPYRGGFAIVFVAGTDVGVYGNANYSDKIYSRGQDAELCGAMAAIRFAHAMGWRNIHIRYDCCEVAALVSEYITKDGKRTYKKDPKYPSATAYRNFMARMTNEMNMRVRMSHVPGHSRDRFNSIADRTANKLRID